MALCVNRRRRGRASPSSTSRCTGDTRRVRGHRAAREARGRGQHLRARAAAAAPGDRGREPAARARVVPRLPHVHPARTRASSTTRTGRRSAARTSREELRRILFLQEPGNEEFVVRFQQTTGPVMAKGVEDTAFYRYFRLAALNEVGGNPARFGLTRRRVPRGERAARRALPAASADDVHARHEALARRARAHRRADVARRRVARAARGVARRSSARSTIRARSCSSCRRSSARRRSSASASTRISRRRCARGRSTRTGSRRTRSTRRACRSGRRARRRSSSATRSSSASATSAAGSRSRSSSSSSTSPGVADIYRGDELEDLSLVDPDNRRPVDWEARRRALDGAAGAAPRPTSGRRSSTSPGGRCGFRAEHAEAFAGAYEPVDLGGGRLRVRPRRRGARQLRPSTPSSRRARRTAGATCSGSTACCSAFLARQSPASRRSPRRSAGSRVRGRAASPGRAPASAALRDDRQADDVEVVVRDHGEPQRVGMPFLFVLPSAARPNIVSISDSNSERRADLGAEPERRPRRRSRTCAACRDRSATSRPGRARASRGRASRRACPRRP